MNRLKESAVAHWRVGMVWALALLTLYLYHSHGFLDWQEFLNENPRRSRWVGQFLQSYKDTGQLLLLKPPGSDHVPLESLGDDEGIYLMFSAVDRLGFGFSELQIYWLLTVTPACLYLLLLWPFTSSARWRKTSRLLLLLCTYLALTSLDTYVFVVLLSAMFIFLLIRYREFSELGLSTYLLLFSVVCAGAEQIRSKTGLIFFLLTLFYLVLRNRKWRNLFIVLVTYCSVTLFYNHQVDQIRDARDVWFAEHYQHPISDFFQGEGLTSHVFWHNIFLGLGYDQIDGVRYHDSYAGLTLKREMLGKPVVGGFYPMDTEAEKTLRDAYIGAVSRHPFATCWMYFKKFCVCLVPVLIFSGLLLENDLGRRKFLDWSGQGLERVLVLLPSLIFVAPGMLAWPYPMFFLGAVTTAPGLLLLDRVPSTGPPDSGGSVDDGP